MQLDCDGDGCGSPCGLGSTVAVPIIAGETYLIRIGDWSSFGAGTPGAEFTITLLAPAITDLDCSASAYPDITVSWVNPVTYDSIEVFVDGTSYTTLGGAETSASISGYPDGTYEVCVTGTIGALTTTVCCTVDLYSPLSNDECVDAIPVFEGTNPFFNIGATESPELWDDSLCPFTAMGSLNNDVWYVFTATADAEMSIDGCAAGGDTSIVVYEAADCSLIDLSTQVACNGDAQGGICPPGSAIFTSYVEPFPVTNGATYYIRIGSYGSYEGSGTFDIILSGPAVTDLVCTVTAPDVDLSWVNPVAFDSIEVYLNGLLDQTLPGTATGATIAGLADGNYSVCVVAYVGTLASLDVCCSIDVITGGGLLVLSEGAPALVPEQALASLGYAPGVDYTLVTDAVQFETYLDAASWDGFVFYEMYSGLSFTLQEKLAFQINQCKPFVMVYWGYQFLDPILLDALGIASGTNFQTPQDFFPGAASGHPIWNTLTDALVDPLIVDPHYNNGSEMITSTGAMIGEFLSGNAAIVESVNGVSIAIGHDLDTIEIATATTLFANAIDYVYPYTGTCVPAIDPVAALTCDLGAAEGEVNLSWTNPVVYDSIEIYVDGTLETTIGGTDTSVSLTGLATLGTYEFCVVGQLAGYIGLDVCCSLYLPGDVTGLVVVIDQDNPASPGLIDDPAAVSAALTNNGVDHVILPSIDEIAIGTPSAVFVLLGTYPDNGAMTDAQGEILSVLQDAGVPLYVSGGDFWGFAVSPTNPYYLGDGVSGTGTSDGGDTFTGMLGQVGTFTEGLDALYNQDQDPGNDWTDEFLAAAPGEDEHGDDAVAIWEDNDEPGVFTGVRYVTPDGIGNVINTTWEFGGYAGDQDALMGVYLTFMDIGGGGGPQFQRGDANDDGLYNIGDAVYSLSALFVPGSPPPPCIDAADANDDGLFNIGDAVYSLSALFVPGSPPPPAPTPPACGEDPTEEVPDLGCDAYSSCP